MVTVLSFDLHNDLGRTWLGIITLILEVEKSMLREVT